MNKPFHLEILPQPDETTCGPTCLHALYTFYNDTLKLANVIEETATLEEGGTLAAYLAIHAMRRGYACTMYTYNLRVFDPTWFDGSPDEMIEKLEARLDYKRTANNGEP